MLTPLRSDASDTPPARSGASSADWWAFRPLSSPEIPRSVRKDGASGPTDPPHPIDAFIHERLAAKSLRPSPQAAPRELLRRLHLDLVGLPPTPDEIADFERDPFPSAWARRVDALLASPRYGERWGPHWLDIVRFAQSNGYERDSEKREAWRYRDYVIRAFNQDKPYDRFIREQIAGDALAPALVDDSGRGRPGEMPWSQPGSCAWESMTTSPTTRSRPSMTNSTTSWGRLGRPSSGGSKAGKGVSS